LDAALYADGEIDSQVGLFQEKAEAESKRTF
jgi:hypothetical protein